MFGFFRPNLLCTILLVQTSLRSAYAHRLPRRGMNAGSGISMGNQGASVTSAPDPNWPVMIKEYIASDIFTLPGLQPYAEEFKTYWSQSSTSQSTVTTSLSQTSKVASGCDRHGYMVVTATSLVTLSALYTHLQKLQTQCHDKGYTQTVSVIQTTKSQVSTVMHSVVQLTSASNVDSCALPPSQSPYCGQVQTNMDSLKSSLSSIEQSLTVEHVDISTSTINTDIDDCNSDDLIGVTNEGYQLAQTSCQGVTTSIPAQGSTGIHFDYTSPGMRLKLTKFIPKGCVTVAKWFNDQNLNYPNSGPIPQGSIPAGVAITPPSLPGVDGIDNGSPHPQQDNTSSSIRSPMAQLIHVTYLGIFWGAILTVLIM
ncbi:hypothetical protein CROQUDRAFT_697500 [Cronartium quercuum f. sp. fusiforme G11]|uniref:Uncharacterized protein n=1 Tax=Cronartium quercuum f. sp. fusiforme G11 TaxID=708437 RepID=A0A9P6TCS7_9BASI|nr:hypothetical protein CROQUDRAFT_697500 [Cronartium quercuum f. sp. fusiforme G11]